MSGKSWVMADPHFGHANMMVFEPPRPFANVEEMDSALIKNWNELVAPDDRVYLMGDVAMTKRGFLGAVPHLKGRIVLVRGNHDNEKLSFYSQWFDDIRACVPKKGFILTHIPIHEQSLARWSLNIHGHLHSNVVKLPDGKPDPRYVCVSAEQIDYRPKLLSTVLQENGL